MDLAQSFQAFSKRSHLEKTFKQYLKVILIWCPVCSLLFMFGFGSFEDFLPRFLISLTISCTVSTCCFSGSLLIEGLYNSYRNKHHLEPKGGVVWGVLTSYPFLIPGMYLGFRLAEKLSTFIGHSWTPPGWNDYSSGIIFGIMLSGFFSLFEVLREAKQAKNAADLRYKTLENEKLKAQISALTAQMNPHLLFNSLNTIASTITTDPQSAEDMVVQLSELYRGILKSAKGDIHSLKDELSLCQSYLEIEKKRFGSRIEFNINVSEKIDPAKYRIPVLLIQPLVENAIKHGLAPKREGGLVRIEVESSATDLVIRVSDNGVGLHTAKKPAGTGTGLANCESRIKLKYGTHSRFTFSRTRSDLTTACIEIPMNEVARD